MCGWVTDAQGRWNRMCETLRGERSGTCEKPSEVRYVMNREQGLWASPGMELQAQCSGGHCRLQARCAINRNLRP